jgi:hypothetical protein
VGRRWLGERPRLRRDSGADGADAGDGSWFGDFIGFDEPIGIVAGLVFALVLALLLLVAWPLVAIAIEVVILILVAAVGAAGRILFRRPWTVRARTTAVRSVEWKVSGWRESTDLIERVCEAIAAGTDPRQIRVG